MRQATSERARERERETVKKRRSEREPHFMTMRGRTRQWRVRVRDSE